MMVVTWARVHCLICTRSPSDMYALALGRWRALGHRACISGNALVPMLQRVHCLICVHSPSGAGGPGGIVRTCRAMHSCLC